MINQKIKNIASAFLFILLAFPGMQTAFSVEQPQSFYEDLLDIHQAEFIISNPHYYDDHVLKLDCQWDFYNSLISPGLFYPENMISDYININKITLPHVFEAGNHYGTYHLRLKNLVPDTAYSMNVYRKISSSARIYCNGKAVKFIGNVGKNESYAVPGDSMEFVNFQTDKNGTIDIVIHVSNYVMPNGGITTMLSITSKDFMYKIYGRNIFFEMFISGLLLAVGLYNLIIFVFNRKSYIYIYLFFITCCMEFFVLVAGFSILAFFFPNISFSFMKKSAVIPMFIMLPMYIAYIRNQTRANAKIHHTLKTTWTDRIFSNNRSYMRTSARMNILRKTVRAFLRSELSIPIILLVPVIIFLIVCPTEMFFHSLNFILPLIVLTLIRTLFFFFQHTRKITAPFIFNIVMFVLIFPVSSYSQSSVIGMDFWQIGCFWAKIIILVFVMFQASVTASSRNDLIKRSEKEIMVLEKNNNSAYRFIPQEMIKLLPSASILDTKAGENIQAEVLLLYADIRNFTEISENLGSEKVFHLLTDYYMNILPVIREHNGIPVQFIGDGVLVVFMEKNETVCQCALKVQSVLKEMRKEARKNGHPELHAGIGIHTGRIAFGVIGNETRLDTVAISKATKEVAELEGFNKKLNSNILVSDESMIYFSAVTNCMFDGHTISNHGNLEVVYSAIPLTSE